MTSKPLHHKTRHTIYLRDDLHRELKSQCALRDTSVSVVINQLIERHLNGTSQVPAKDLLATMREPLDRTSAEVWRSLPDPSDQSLGKHSQLIELLPVAKEEE